MNVLFRLGLLAVLVINSAVAAPIFFTDRDAFLSYHSDILQAEDFEAAEAFGSRVGGGVSELGFEHFVAQSDLPALKILSRSYSGNRNTTPSGRQYLTIDTDRSRQGVLSMLTFGAHVEAVAFNVIDHDGDDVEFEIDGVQFTLPEVRNGGVAFFGVNFSERTSLNALLSIDTGRDAQIALDDMLFATMSSVVSVDEPGTFALLLISLAGIFCLRCQKTTKKM